MFDKNPLLYRTADKYEVRGFVREKLGEPLASEILVPLYCVIETSSNIPFEDFPEQYVVKANHASGWNIFVSDNSEADKVYLEKTIAGWLSSRYGFYKHENIYQKIEPKVTVEALLSGQDQVFPKDYKFHMLNGKCEFIQVDVDRFSEHKRTLYDDKWNILDVTLKYPSGGQVEKPKNFYKMLDIAKSLSCFFDYVRVDLYEVDGKVYFGELSHCVGGGHEKFMPEEFDWKLGEKWKN